MKRKYPIVKITNRGNASGSVSSTLTAVLDGASYYTCDGVDLIVAQARSLGQLKTQFA